MRHKLFLMCAYKEYFFLLSKWSFFAFFGQHYLSNEILIERPVGDCVKSNEEAIKTFGNNEGGRV
jgi:hypothetical protein